MIVDAHADLQHNPKPEATGPTHHDSRTRIKSLVIKAASTNIDKTTLNRNHDLYWHSSSRN